MFRGIRTVKKHNLEKTLTRPQEGAEDWTSGFGNKARSKGELGDCL
jgi:hypothetical protein